MINHRVMRWVVATAVGILLAVYSFERIADPEPALQRAREEAVVQAARRILEGYITSDRGLEIVDPMATNRKVGKVYVYPAGRGWEVSGHYRRHKQDRWHPYLMALDRQVSLLTLSVKDADPELAAIAVGDPAFSAVP